MIEAFTGKTPGLSWMYIDQRTAVQLDAMAADHGSPDRGLGAADHGLRAVRVAAALAAVADAHLGTAVWAARKDGASWAQVGQALGVTRQAAQQRFGRRSA